MESKDIIDDIAFEINKKYSHLENTLITISAETIIEAMKKAKQGKWLDVQNILVAMLRKRMEAKKRETDRIVKSMIVKSLVLNEMAAKGMLEEQLQFEFVELQKKKVKKVYLSEPSIQAYNKFVRLNDLTTQAAVEDALKRHKRIYTELGSNPKLMAEFSLGQTESIQNLYKAIVSKINLELKDGLTVVSMNKKNDFKVYAERNVRTELNRQTVEVGKVFGQQAGVVFYICSSHYDCADDHKDYQGKIYVRENWRSIAKPEFHEAIEQAIAKKNILTYEWATEWENGKQDGPALITRPNCRHKMFPLSIAQVVNQTEDQLLNQFRLKRGEYDKTKYAVSQMQRHNERQIRKYRDKINTNIEIQKNTNDPQMQQVLQIQINRDNVYLKRWNKKQTDLLAKYSHLTRDKRRETVQIILNDLGVRYEVKQSATL